MALDVENAIAFEPAYKEVSLQSVNAAEHRDPNTSCELEPHLQILAGREEEFEISSLS
jgi:hypothetical protein